MFRDRTRRTANCSAGRLAKIVGCRSVLAHTERNGACYPANLQSAFRRIINSSAITAPRSSRFTKKAIVTSRSTSARVTPQRWCARSRVARGTVPMKPNRRKPAMERLRRGKAGVQELRRQS